jgi:hypothetical protein
MAKFRVPDLHKKADAALFSVLGREHEFYRSIQPKMNIRIPKMVFGDIHRSSGSGERRYSGGEAMMLFEFIFADFSLVQNPLAHDRAVLMMKAIARIHRSFWGGTTGPCCSDINFIPYQHQGANIAFPKAANQHLQTLYTGLCAPAANAAAQEIKESLPEMFGGMEGIMVHMGTIEKWMTVCHGDVRTDNWFFEENFEEKFVLKKRITGSLNVSNSVGLLDWKQAIRSSCSADISWFFCTSLDADANNAEELLSVYFNALILSLAAGGTSDTSVERAQVMGLTMAEFKEELALAHIYSFAKVVIRIGGLSDNDDPSTVDAMRYFCRRSLIAMQAHDSVGVYRRFTQRKLLSQQSKMAPSIFKGGNGVKSVPNLSSDLNLTAYLSVSKTDDIAGPVDIVGPSNDDMAVFMPKRPTSILAKKECKKVIPS